MPLGAIGAGLIGAGIGAGGNLGSSLISGAFSASQADKARKAQAYYAHRQNQILVKDLKKAGLNPMLAYMKAGPGVPSPAQASLPPADLAGGASAGSSAVESAFRSKKAKSETARTDQEKQYVQNQNLLIQATIRQANADAASAEETAKLNRVERQTAEAKFKWMMHPDRMKYYIPQLMYNEAGLGGVPGMGAGLIDSFLYGEDTSGRSTKKNRESLRKHLKELGLSEEEINARLRSR